MGHFTGQMPFAHHRPCSGCTSQPSDSPKCRSRNGPRRDPRAVLLGVPQAAGAFWRTSAQDSAAALHPSTRATAAGRAAPDTDQHDSSRHHSGNWSRVSTSVHFGVLPMMLNPCAILAVVRLDFLFVIARDILGASARPAKSQPHRCRPNTPQRNSGAQPAHGREPCERAGTNTA